MTKLMLMCEGAYIATPPDEPVPTFEVTQDHREVIVVRGEVRCVNSKERLVAPCVVPHSVRYVQYVSPTLPLPLLSFSPLSLPPSLPSLFLLLSPLSSSFSPLSLSPYSPNYGREQLCSGSHLF